MGAQAVKVFTYLLRTHFNIFNEVRSNTAGFTLVELLLAMVLAGVVTAG
ncbi:MAG: hypothetical protein DRH15_00400, partial [Deltaproteobacteria bacterium]